MKKNEIRVIKLSKQGIIEWLNETLLENRGELFGLRKTDNYSIRIIYEDGIDGLTMYLIDNRNKLFFDREQLDEVVNGSDCEIIDSLFVNSKNFESLYIKSDKGKLSIENESKKPKMS